MGIKEIMDNDSADVKLAFFDLDGTIIDEKVNSTFDFLKFYLKHRYGIIGVIRYKLASLITWFISKIFKDEAFRRKFFITLCIFALKIDDLIQFAIKYWLPYVTRYVNVNVLNFARKLGHEGFVSIVLTACIEVPAMLISKHLGFERCIAIKLRFFGPLIVGISEDTYGHLKFESARRLLGCKQVQQAIYIADAASITIEKATSYVNKVYCVNKSIS